MKGCLLFLLFVASVKCHEEDIIVTPVSADDEGSQIDAPLTIKNEKCQEKYSNETITTKGTSDNLYLKDFLLSFSVWDYC